MEDSLFFKDLYVGQKFSSEKYLLSEAEIIDFASAYDPQIFHTQPDKAGDTFFKGHAASGWQTVAVTMRLLVYSIPLNCGIIGMGGNLTWFKPVRPGDSLRAESEIIDMRPSNSKTDRVIVTLLVKTINNDDEIVQTLETKILVFSKEKRFCIR